MSILIVSNIWNSPTRTTEEVWLLSNLDNYRKYQKCFFGNVLISEAVAWRCSVKKILLEILQNLQENNCARVFFNKVVGNFIEKETLAQVFSCEFCEISTEHSSCGCFCNFFQTIQYFVNSKDKILWHSLFIYIF